MWEAWAQSQLPQNKQGEKKKGSFAVRSVGCISPLIASCGCVLVNTPRPAMPGILSAPERVSVLIKAFKYFKALRP